MISSRFTATRLLGVGCTSVTPPQSTWRMARRSAIRQSVITHASGSAPKAEFNLPLAVGLAGCTFQAYLEPKGAEGYKDVALNGTTTVFTDRAFLQEMFEGILYLELVGGSFLREADKEGETDPYVVMSVNNSTAKSKVVNRSVSPQFKQRFILYIKSVDNDTVKIRLYNKGNWIRKEADLGFTLMSLAPLADGKVHELDLKVSGPGSYPQAKIQLRATMMRFQDFSEPELNKMTTSKMDVPAGGGPGVDYVPGVMDSMVKARMGRRNPIGNILTNVQAAGAQVSKVMADVSKLAGWDLDGKAPPNPWNVLADMAGRGSESFTPVAFVENLTTDTQVWLFRNEETREAVISFRGTEQVKWKDVATDANFAPISFNVERIDDNAGLPFTMRVLKAISPTEEVRVHNGFLGAYDSVRQQVVRLLDTITGAGEKGNWKVYVTGHSLGGALATVCTFELAARDSPAREIQHVGMYNYGAPRVGNKLFAQQFEEMVPDSWRIINPNDVIPTIPRLMGYTHVRHSVSVLKNGQLLVENDDGGRDYFGEGKSGTDVIAELAERVKENNGKWEEIYDEILEKEMKILETLKDGSALEEHMETFYLDTLKACVQASVAK